MIQTEINELIKERTGNGATLTCKAEYLDITNSYPAAHMLSQLIYWAERTKDLDGWIYKTDSDWNKELRLSRFQVVNAKTTLQELGLIEVKVKRDRTGRTVTHYRLVPNFNDVFTSLLDATYSQTEVQETNTVEREKVTRPNVSNLRDQMKETDDSYITKNTAIEYAKHTRTYIMSEDCEEILQRWNDYGITVALSVTKALRIALDELVQVCSLADFFTAMDNYAKIVKDDKYYFKHKYALETFISAGLKKNKGFVHFLDANEPFIRFRDSDEDKSIDFKPVTERFNPSKKADFESNTYYGFDIDSIKTIENRMDDVDYMLSKDRIKWTFGKFWALEMCIASLLFTRKTDPQPEKLNKYIKVWEDNVETFEGMLET